MGAGLFDRSVACRNVHFLFLSVYIQKVIFPIADADQPVFPDFIERKRPNIKPVDDGIDTGLERRLHMIPPIFQRDSPATKSNCPKNPNDKPEPYHPSQNQGSSSSHEPCRGPESRDERQQSGTGLSRNKADSRHNQRDESSTP